jgi:hypothetical protein
MPRKNTLLAAANALLVSLLMTAVVSLVTTLLNLHAFDARHWLGAWALSWLIAFPTLLAVMPLVRGLVARWAA